MEAIGLLASGLAHDFNNTLTVAGGFAELIKAETADADVATDAAAIVDVVEKARELTRRLLAVARDTSRPSEPVDVCGVVVELAPLLRQPAGRNDRGRARAADRPMVACLDTGQLEQALINLAVNARDAMPDGGTITIGVRATDAAIGAAGGSARGGVTRARSSRSSSATPGPGSRPTSSSSVFEPFFTTKATGKGSGLGPRDGQRLRRADRRRGHGRVRARRRDDVRDPAAGGRDAVGGAGAGPCRRLEAADGTPGERPTAQRRRVARPRELTRLLLGI